MENYLKNSFLMFFLVVLILIIKNDLMNNIFYEENINNINFLDLNESNRKLEEENENEENEIPLLSEFHTNLPKTYLFFHNIFSKDFSGICSNL